MIFSVQAVAFDLDGTLINSIADLASAANTMREQFGLVPLAQARIASFVGDGAAMLVARALSDQYDVKVGEHPDHALAMTRFHDNYHAHLADDTEAYDGVHDTLKALKARGLALAVITNKPFDFTLPLLAALGLSDYFDVVLGGDSLPEKKPLPHPLLHTALVLRCQPEDMLMVGDSKNDVLAARAAGCPVVVVTYGYGDQPEALNADAHIAHFSELQALVALEPAEA